MQTRSFFPSGDSRGGAALGAWTPQAAPNQFYMPSNIPKAKKRFHAPAEGAAREARQLAVAWRGETPA